MERATTQTSLIHPGFSQKEFEVGSVYRMVYNDKTRIVLVLETNDPTMTILVHDFAVGFRRFATSKILSYANVDDQVVCISDCYASINGKSLEEAQQSYQDQGCQTFIFSRSDGPDQTSFSLDNPMKYLYVVKL